jgi:RNA polymerase sigma-70 factor (ECF subfamily)
MDHASATDEELALALQGGDEAAFDELVRRHQGRVYAVAYRITSNREDALDVSQEVFVKAYRKVDTWRPHGGFVPWLMRLTANQAIDHLRRRRRHRHVQMDEEYIVGQGEAPVESTEQQVGAHEIEARIQEALGVLSPAQRAVFAMRHYEGMALADIAEAMGCTTGSVKVHLFRATKKLQAELEPYYRGEE